MVSPLAQRSVVRYLIKTGKCSEWQACVVVGLSGEPHHFVQKVKLLRKLSR